MQVEEVSTMLPAAGEDRLSSLDSYYRNLEQRFLVCLSTDYETLVTPNGNAYEPIHRWFHVKEAYSHRLLERVVKEIALDDRAGLSIIDPFCGSGTTAVSAAQRVATGQTESAAIQAYEINPFLANLSQAKLDAYINAPYDFLSLAKRIAALVSGGKVFPHAVPQLSTFSNPRYFPPQQLYDLLMLRSALDYCRHLDFYTPEAIRLASVCLAAVTEPSSRLRRDGRALRFEIHKQPCRPVAEFLANAHMFDEDLPANAFAVTGQVQLGDVRASAAVSCDADLALFSPPYPNNIDYTEVYKLENWLLGWINDQNEFTRQRQRTLRSHPSVRFERDYSEHSEDRLLLADLLQPLVEAIPMHTRYVKDQTRLVRGYFEDMLSVLRSLHQRLKPGGRLVYVVGNSLHGNRGETRFLIAADIIIAAIAELVGFRIDRIDVARKPKRRTSMRSFVRESVVTATRP